MGSESEALAWGSCREVLLRVLSGGGGHTNRKGVEQGLVQ